MNNNRLLALFFLLITVLGSVYGKKDKLQKTKRHGIDLSEYNVKLVYQTDFSIPELIDREEDMIHEEMMGYLRTRKPMADTEWIAEGWGDVRISKGKLWVAPVKLDDELNPLPDSLLTQPRSHMVIWNHKVFPANFMLSFTVNHHGSDNGLTLLFFNASMQNENFGMFDLEAMPRRANYRNYHAAQLKNYTDSYWSRNERPPGEHLTNRLRKNPGMNMLAAGKSRTKRSSKKDYQIRIFNYNGHIKVEVNGKIVSEAYDPNPLGNGRIGLRCMKGVKKVSYDDFKVYELAK